MFDDKRLAESEIRVANLSATAEFVDRFDLDNLSAGVDHAEYEPEQYHALVFRPDSSSTRVLVNASGKCIVVGAKSWVGAETALERFVAEIGRLGYSTAHSPLVLRNLVATLSLSTNVDLAELARRANLSELDLQYEPGHFPGAIARLPETRTTCLIFSSGRVNITGAKSDPELLRAAHFARELVESLKQPRCPLPFGEARDNRGPEMAG